MRILLCGQRSFGKAVLKRLYEDGHSIVGVAAPPQEKYYDKIVGYAQLKGIPVICDLDRLAAVDVPDGTEIIVAAHAHQFISMKAIEKCKYGGIGFHPSLLPLHRGRDAVRWAVAMKDPVTAGTVYWLNNVVDGGDILDQRLVFIDKTWDYHDLWKELFTVGVNMVSDAIRSIEDGTAGRTPQDERFATFEPAWSSARLKRNDLLALGGFNGST